MNKKKKVLIMLICFSAIIPGIVVSAQINSEDSFNLISDIYINSSLPKEEILIELKDIKDSVIIRDIGFEELYMLSRISLLEGVIRKELSQTQESIKALEFSQAFASEALDIKSDSDCWRIMAEAGSLIMLQKGLPYIIANAGTVQEHTDKAIALNSGNIRAQVLNATGLINRPFLFGGDVNKGVKILENLSTSGSTKTDRFFVLYNLGIAYKKQNNLEKAESSCLKALRLYPGNKPTKELLAQIQS